MNLIINITSSKRIFLVLTLLACVVTFSCTTDTSDPALVPTQTAPSRPHILASRWAAVTGQKKVVKRRDVCYYPPCLLAFAFAFARPFGHEGLGPRLRKFEVITR